MTNSTLSYARSFQEQKYHSIWDQALNVTLRMGQWTVPATWVLRLVNFPQIWENTEVKRQEAILYAFLYL